MNENILEIAVPTYNRTLELAKCLNSIFKALKLLSRIEKKNIGIAIYDNSTKDLKKRKKIISKFKRKFKSVKINYFKYQITGFNIGSNNNFATLLIGSNSDYTWILPDDDVARFDSIKTILKTIKLYRPCFINGGWEKKSLISYKDDKFINEDNMVNDVKTVLKSKKNKINTFLLKYSIQLQEYVYKTSQIKKFFLKEKNIELINNMSPGLYAIYCMLDDSPSVLLKRSLGIFRDGEPNSEWRHLFYRYSLIDWPTVCEKIYKFGWISKIQFDLSIKIYQNTIINLAHRPDILLGINRKYELSFFKLFYFHRNILIKAILISIPSVFHKVFKKLFK